MLSGTVVSLRAFDRRHLAVTRDWMNDLELAQLLDRCRPVTDAEHEHWYSSLLARNDVCFMAIEETDTGRHIGNVWLWNIDWRNSKAELRIVIGERTALGQGSGTEAIGLLCEYAFERLNLRRIYAYVLASNPRAVRAFQKSGFDQEGLLKGDRWGGSDYVDVHVLARLRSVC